MCEVAIQYNESYNEVIYSYANNVNTIDGGTHVEGLKMALTKVINDAGRKLNVLKENDKLTGEDVREGITAVVSVKLDQRAVRVADQGQAEQQLDPRVRQ